MKRGLVAAVFSFALGLVLLPRNASALPTKKLWIAWDSQTAVNAQRTTDFFNCVLGATDWNALVAQFPYGEALTLGGTATISGCSSADFACVVGQAGFAIQNDDVLLHYWAGTGCVTGHWHAAVAINGVSIRAAEAEVGANANCQTALGMMEVYDSAADSDATECCNGGYSQNPTCVMPANPAWYDLDCGSTKYAVGNVGDAAAPMGCHELCFEINAACSATGAPCCPGLVCDAGQCVTAPSTSSASTGAATSSTTSTTSAATTNATGATTSIAGSSAAATTGAGGHGGSAPHQLTYHNGCSCELAGAEEKTGAPAGVALLALGWMHLRRRARRRHLARPLGATPRE